ncbi:hypothetical protein H4696_004417 [Amycolatopsis lexingtonensis]|uniref:Uncharacterized protein n=1 Tax=Amycolatopsis lexingtonensis TaxID=218822 RepID=A0ABR9I330_9PSEU|nr:hypothetical protein [Amycolatopsis lexingtonensis]MBE1497317.1 hypothetical protein [Amycolatopsis lexingtonensis]
MRSPRDFAAAVDREAAGLVDRTDVSRPAAAAAPRAEETARAFQASVSTLRAAPGQLDQKVTEVIQSRTVPPTLDPSGRLRLTLPEIPALRLPPPDYFRLPYSYDPGRYSYTLPDRFTVPPEIARVPRIAPPPRVSPRIFFW